MKERPILFSGPMVRAILEGRKTVTRRLVKGGQIPKERRDEPDPAFRWSAVGQHDPRWGFRVTGATEAECAQELTRAGRCPYGQPGDRLWVRESTEADYESCDSVVLSRYTADKALVLYWADDDGEPIQAVDHWDYPRDVRPSIHMKRDACRILLEITDVRVERLHDISLQQVRAEGCEVREFWLFGADAEQRQQIGARVFERLWTDTGGDWAANPWVWVVEFKRVTP